jgi:hypothetical protein
MKNCFTLLFAVLLTGCSFPMMGKPSVSPSSGAVRCESRRVVPAVDAVGAGAFVVLTGVTTLALLGGDEPAPTRILLAVDGTLLAAAGVYLASSIFGFDRAAKCRAAKAGSP